MKVQAISRRCVCMHSTWGINGTLLGYQHGVDAVLLPSLCLACTCMQCIHLHIKAGPQGLQCVLCDGPSPPDKCQMRGLHATLGPEQSWKHCAGDCAALQVVCQGQATVVFLDQAYKPIRVPATVKEALMQLHQEYKAGLVQG